MKTWKLLGPHIVAHKMKVTCIITVSIKRGSCFAGLEQFCFCLKLLQFWNIMNLVDVSHLLKGRNSMSRETRNLVIGFLFKSMSLVLLILYPNMPTSYLSGKCSFIFYFQLMNRLASWFRNVTWQLFATWFTRFGSDKANSLIIILFLAHFLHSR